MITIFINDDVSLLNVAIVAHWMNIFIWNIKHGIKTLRIAHQKVPSFQNGLDTMPLFCQNACAVLWGCKTIVCFAHVNSVATSDGSCKRRPWSVSKIIRAAREAEPGGTRTSCTWVSCDKHSQEGTRPNLCVCVSNPGQRGRGRKGGSLEIREWGREGLRGQP